MGCISSSVGSLYLFVFKCSLRFPAALTVKSNFYFGHYFHTQYKCVTDKDKQIAYAGIKCFIISDFNLGYGNNLIINPGGGNFPPGCSWSTGQGGEPCTPSQAIDDHTKKLAEFYNKVADDAAKMGCRIGLHNHTWEHAIFMQDGTSFWDYFFSNTNANVCMEQDVGWTTCAGDTYAGVNPMVQYKKYPHRSPTLHAKENGMGKGVKKFDAILGKPGCDENGKPCATPVDWDALIPVTEKDGVEWYVVECERHFEDLSAVLPSYNFLKAKGLN